MKQWFKSGTPFIWLNAGAVAIAMVAVFGLLVLILVRGMSHFWPAEVVAFHYQNAAGELIITGEIVESETVPAEQLHDIDTTQAEVTRYLVKTGNRDILGSDFRWLYDIDVVAREYPQDLVVLERIEWGNFYGTLHAVLENGEVVATGEAAWPAFMQRLARSNALREQILDLEKHDIGAINYQLEQLRLQQRRLQLDAQRGEAFDSAAQARIEAEREALNQRYQNLLQQSRALYADIGRDAVMMRLNDGSEVEIALQKIVKAWQPNRMSVVEKLGFYVDALWRFITEDPREANTEGGIFPAIFGTVMMVILMSIMVTPFGVVAAVYLREYARQGAVIRIIRIAVNNLAGVPSIVYGVFGLGFFVYYLGANIDRAFYAEALPAPTFGTPGLLWSSLTLALLTLPVVIVATEEGLSRIPRSLREGSIGLGATQAETLWRVVLPMASPAIMTGLILAVARAAGEVAPLMLVGVVKLAPSLPLDGNYPFIHLDRKFMHLGFHIYDVGFQSPNVEAARPLVYATSFILVLVIVSLNLTAINLRNRLREKYRALDG